MTGNLIEIPVADPWKARQVLGGVPEAKSVTLFGHRLHVTVGDVDRDLSTVLTALAGAGLQPRDPRPVLPSLEDVFISMIERGEGATHERAA
jgi:ABC-2 type transport system ATP-binding protein